MVPRTAAAGGDEQSYRPLNPGPGTQIPPAAGDAFEPLADQSASQPGTQR